MRTPPIAHNEKLYARPHSFGMAFERLLDAVLAGGPFFNKRQLKTQIKEKNITFRACNVL
jgi:hypothetical protein